MKRTSWAGRTAAAVLATLVGAGPMLLGAAPAAQAVDPSRGQPGFCPTDEGVTVVIDFQGLGGTAIVRCAPGPVGKDFTGHSALLDAGIQLEGTRRWGEAFICRLEGRPRADEAIPIKGNPSYKEPCVNTPPAAGYWSYWHATNGGQWQYSQWGVKNRQAIKGGFEGWSFSLNASQDSNPKPRITPRRPNSAAQPQVGQPTSRPSSDDLNERQQDSGGSGGSRPGGGGGSDGGSAGDTETTVRVPGPGQQPGQQQGQQPGQQPEQSQAPGNGQPGGTQQPNAPLPPGLPRNGSAPAGDPRTDQNSPSSPTGQAEQDVEWTGGEPVAAETTPSGTAPGGVPVTTIVAGFVVLALVAAALLTARRRRRTS